MSYSNVLSDIQNLKTKQEDIEKKVDKISTKIEYEEEKVKADSISNKSVKGQN